MLPLSRTAIGLPLPHSAFLPLCVAGCIQLPAQQRPTAQQALDIIVESMSIKEPWL